MWIPAPVRRSFRSRVSRGWETFRRGRGYSVAGSDAGHPHRRSHLDQQGAVRDRRRRAGQRPPSRTVRVLIDMVREISVTDLKARRDRGEKPLVVDVREEWELKLASIPDVVHVPMSQIPARLPEFSPDTETIVMCHAGGRSMRVAHFLVNQGFTNVANLSGGISAWSERVDATVPRY